MSQGSTPTGSTSGSPLGSPPHPPPQPSSLGQLLIPLVNKLQDIFSQVGSGPTVDLPQVAVVGSQSSGKSSVLEALVGRDFLPRGSDVCTRRPLVLQLVQTKRKHEDRLEVVEWGEFLHIPGKRFTDFVAIRREIEAETDRELGLNKGISDNQIRLKIFSPNILNITLVDLPGITKVPVGDQPSDIESRIRTMILSYIKHETCIILAVSPANADLANSDALQVARIADPDGSRTIGVITKLDIMDRGTDARNVLLGNVVPLRLGYVGVINRSQQDAVTNRSIHDALIAEDHFFRSRPVYHNISDRCGAPQLAKRLNQILVQHIKAILPDLKSQINIQVVSLKKELASYGELIESKSGQGVLLLNILTKYSHGFSSIIDGKYEEMPTSELSGGARIHYIFQAIFVKCLEEVDPCDDLSDDEIRTAIQNATGPKNVLFVPEVPFEVLIRKQIARLLDPSLQCAHFVFDELVKISHRCESSNLQRFPILRRQIEEVSASFLREGLAPAETMITHLIEMEMDYINTSHSGFIGGSKAVEVALQKQQHVSKDTADCKEFGGDRSPLPERASEARALFVRTNAPFLVADQRPASIPQEKAFPTGTFSTGSWGISSIFSGTEAQTNGKDHNTSRSYVKSVQGLEPIVSTIQLKQPPPVLRAADAQNEQAAVEILVTRLLLKSYYDIVRKNIQDLVPKAIMHFLVNHVRRDLHNVFIKKLYRESLFEELLQEQEEVVIKRKHCKEALRVLQQAAWTLDELPLEYEAPVKVFQHVKDATGLPIPTRKGAAISQSFYLDCNGELAGMAPQSPSSLSYSSSPRFSKPKRSHSEPGIDNTNGRLTSTIVGYPIIKT